MDSIFYRLYRDRRTETMKIGIDVHAAERDGSGNCTYIRNLITYLLRIDKDNEYLLLATEPSHPFYQSISQGNVRVVYVMGSPAWYRAFVELPLVCLKEDVDILHVQYFAPVLQRSKLVLTVHDLSPFHHPEYFNRYERFLFSTLLPSSIRRASVVITPSQTTSNDLKKLLHTPEEKLVTAYPGLSHLNQSDGKKNDFLTEKRFILYVGRLDPRKNLARLIEAFTLWKQRHGMEHRLIIAGRPYYDSSSMQAALERSEFRNEILFPGYVDECHLSALYRAADAFVYVSEFEGFGFPPLEAMVSGTPVVASNIDPFREVLEDAALLIDPFDIEAIAAGIHAVVTDCELRAKLLRISRDLLPKYSWEQAAIQTLKAYRKAIEQ
ncbi:MAG: hypothetical protein C5B54_08395 [Acidobacteria bacterium]|nr:MAG: hypothetical protein C5B54_08395 [Acidobacteriota bacterium]